MTNVNAKLISMVDAYLKTLINIQISQSKLVTVGDTIKLKFIVLFNMHGHTGT